jgi:hypothetical protein
MADTVSPVVPSLRRGIAARFGVLEGPGAAPVAIAT